jgi:hypothetical protein
MERKKSPDPSKKYNLKEATLEEKNKNEENKTTDYINSKNSEEYDLNNYKYRDYRTNCTIPEPLEQILARSVKESKNGFEAVSKAIEEASMQKLLFLQDLIARSQRVNMMILEGICNLDKNYNSLSGSLEELRKYKKEE